MSEIAERTEMLLPGPALALGGLLGVPVPDLEGGEGLPLLWHWVYLLDRPAQADLGPDGHPVRGTVPAPPGPGRRRMWAGGQVRTSGALRCGEPATRRSRVELVQDKQGRSGPLTFVAVRHQILQRDSVIIDERQDIVYREAASAAGQAAGEAAAASCRQPAFSTSRRPAASRAGATRSADRTESASAATHPARSSGPAKVAPPALVLTAPAAVRGAVISARRAGGRRR